MRCNDWFHGWCYDFLDSGFSSFRSFLQISFNGAKSPEAFIGDYAYHEPRKEQVTGYILDDRSRWILNMFFKNRGHLPKYIIVTRDGVSEGQIQMVSLIRCSFCVHIICSFLLTIPIVPVNEEIILKGERGRIRDYKDRSERVRRG